MSFLGRRRKQRETPALELIAQTFDLLRTGPRGPLLCYYVGSAPFVLGLLFFWSDMSRSGFAYQRCFAASLGMAALFVWMKCWQTAFAAGLHATLAATQAPRWTPRRVLRLIAVQTALQPAGLLLIPLSILLLVPYPSVYALYQNLTVFGDGTHADSASVAARSRRQALFWPLQNQILVWLLSPWTLGTAMLIVFSISRLIVSATTDMPDIQGAGWMAMAVGWTFLISIPLSPFACVVAGNVAVAAILLPELLRILLGVQTVFTLSGWHGIFNTTFLASVFAVSYLCLDPLAKAAYALRCFYGDSRTTGSDLQAGLRRFEHGGGREQ